MSHIRRLISRQEWAKRKFDERATALCINCGKLGRAHHFEQKMGGYKMHCPTKIPNQCHLNILFEPGTTLEYLQRVYERRHGLR